MPPHGPLSVEQLAELFEGRTRFVELLAERDDPLETAPEVIGELDEAEKLEALDAHPAIGAGGLSARSAAEQGTAAEPEVAAELARLNQVYEQKFGFRFVVFVDWPHACVGAEWVELLAFLPSVAMQGGPHPWEVFESHPAGRGVPRERLQPVLAAVAGFFLQRSTLPPPPGLSTLREFQRGQGIEALIWLRRSLGES